MVHEKLHELVDQPSDKTLELCAAAGAQKGVK